MQGNSKDHLLFFLHKLENKEPFSIIRPNDGEYMVLQGMNFKNIDHWHFSGQGRLIQDLKESIEKIIRHPNGYVGTSCPSCSQEIFDYYRSQFPGLSQKHTYGNLFCNKNWAPFIEFLNKTGLPFYYVGPGQNPCELLNVIDRYFIEEFLLNKWDTVAEQTIESLTQWVAGKNGSVFLFSAGPLSKIFIAILSEKFPESTFIDVGSTLDIFMKGQTNRLYIYSGQQYTNQVCDFQHGHSIDDQPFNCA